MRDVLGPLLARAVRSMAEPFDAKAVLAQMLQMGDEGHNRPRAGSLPARRELSPALVALDAPSDDIAAALRFIGGNEHFFLNLGMPAAKLAMDAARDVPGSTLVTVMARNGTEFGVQTAGTGDRWVTGAAQTPGGPPPPAPRLVPRPSADPGGPLPRRLRPRGRQPRHRRLRHHGDLRRRRVLHGGGAGGRAARRRRVPRPR